MVQHQSGYHLSVWTVYEGLHSGGRSRILILVTLLFLQVGTGGRGREQKVVGQHLKD